MSTLLVVLLFISGVAGLLFVLVFLYKRSNKLETGKLLRRFSELGTEYNLSFTGQEVLKKRVIGVDGLKGNVLFLEYSETCPACSIIDLAKAKSCRVSKSYGSSSRVHSAAGHAEVYLHTIALEFDFLNSDHTVALPFYNHISNSLQDAAELEAKAKNWQSMLTKMMAKKIRA